ncbi:hypothetical protein [Neomegalonema sp.]|uniref:hypothetical protein n=1 Tax=Neomegalonema sp. TaxID=2039713 RepID=UPI00260C6039|nr:hypothetical protein [Neomegalonema sp.]MDD2869650.1 hypothetical protein [Neomegalonema sp.]
MVTKFEDMHAGGFQRGPADTIYINGDLDAALYLFKERLGIDPVKLNETEEGGCSAPFYITVHESLEKASEFERTVNGKQISLDEYKKKPGVMFI